MNNLIKLFKSKINSNQKVKSTDENGKEIYVTHSIADESDLKNFLNLSLSELNQAFETNFAIDDKFLDTFTDILVEGAMMHFLARQALVEQNYMENQINTSSLATMLQEQWKVLVAIHQNKLQSMKANLDTQHDHMNHGDVCPDCGETHYKGEDEFAHEDDCPHCIAEAEAEIKAKNLKDKN